MQNVQSVEITLHSGGSDSSGLLMNPKLDSSNARNGVYMREYTNFISFYGPFLKTFLKKNRNIDLLGQLPFSG